jgi:hypothetical protein
MTVITLTEGQQNAQEAFTEFLANPLEPVFVLKGYSGTGKSTLVRHLIEQLPSLLKTVKLLCPSLPEYEVVLTATTNKAAETLAQITGTPVSTIHSFLGLRVHTDYTSGKTRLVPKDKEIVEQHILFIDEASYVDKNLLDIIFKKTRNCKIVFMGDPAQLTPVKSSTTPVFDANFKGAELTQVVRQAEGNPIIDLSTKFRETVTSGQFFSFKPDGHNVAHLSREDFFKEIEKEFTRPDWSYQDSKILAWTNKSVVGYNHYVRDLVQGDPELKVGDYAICNKFISVKRNTVKTDQLVLITSIAPAQEFGVQGKIIGIDGSLRAFMPNSLAEKKARINQAKSNEDYAVVEHIESEWIDLRAAYACTINKAQGSTFDRVYIDLDDIGKCSMGDQIARMLYVAVSRARHQVFLVGDIA